MVYQSVNMVKKAIYLILLIGGANAFWRLECDGSVGLARIDPLISYGRAADHVHTIKGGSGKTLISFTSFQDCFCSNIIVIFNSIAAPIQVYIGLMIYMRI